jgi:hypothetical protein
MRAAVQVYGGGRFAVVCCHLLSDTVKAITRRPIMRRTKKASSMAKKFHKVVPGDNRGGKHEISICHESRVGLNEGYKFVDVFLSSPPDQTTLGKHADFPT